ncbi:CHAD domain-containing protein [bacterium]|nr:CHAD domain-containing protein [bacterium]
MYPTDFINQLQQHCRIAANNYLLVKQFHFTTDVHDMRLALKRLKACFQIIEAINPEFRAAEEFQLLRKLFKRAGKIRDSQVQQQWLSELEPKISLKTAPYQKHLKKQEQKAVKKFRGFIETFSTAVFDDLPVYSTPLLARVETEAGAANVEKFITKNIRHIIRMGSKKRKSAKHYHGLRRDIKELRYMLEFILPVFPHFPWQANVGEAAKPLHHVLGEWHDQIVAEIFLNKISSKKKRRITSIKLLRKTHQKKARQYLLIFEETWPGFQQLLTAGLEHITPKPNQLV